MKVGVELRDGQRNCLIFTPDPKSNYDAYQLGVLVGSGKLNTRTSFMANNRSLIDVNISLDDLCNTLTRLVEPVDLTSK